MHPSEKGPAYRGEWQNPYLYTVKRYAFVLLVALAGCGQPDTAVVITGGDSSFLDTTTSLPQLSGRRIRPVSSPVENAERENWQKPQLVISHLGDLSDKVVADVGSGTGYFTFRLAEKAERVIAIDIDQRFLDYINHRLRDEHLGDYVHVETRLTTPDDTGLKPGEADIVLFVNLYRLIQNRVEYFSKVKKVLPPGGKAVIIDFYKDGEVPSGGPAPGDRVSPETVRSELTSAGFTGITTDSLSLGYQYIITAF